MIERRAYQRHICKDDASLIAGDGRRDLLTLKNFSEGGVCVCGGYPLKVNDLVTITVKAKGFFDRRMKVVWDREIINNNWEAGLEFIKKS